MRKREATYAQSLINSDYSTSIYLFQLLHYWNADVAPSSLGFILNLNLILIRPTSFSLFYQLHLLHLINDEIRQTKKESMFPRSSSRSNNNSRTSDRRPIKSHLLSLATASTTSAPRSLTCVLLTASECEFK